MSFQILYFGYLPVAIPCLSYVFIVCDGSSFSLNVPLCCRFSSRSGVRHALTSTILGSQCPPSIVVNVGEIPSVA
ncbi:hypothetical protein [Bacillus thuringiensis]|uniref:hypothetical protein n=1 Tax=Bacillus thuringiensis TaxID=1428 RepID=UPI003BAF9720